MSKPATNRLTMEEILENLPVPVMIIRHHSVVYGNQSFWEFYLPDEADDYDLNKHSQSVDMYELVKKDNRGALREYLVTLGSLEKSFETILISSDKEYTPVLISGRCLNPANPIESRIHLLCCMDISSKLKNEFLLYEMLEEIDEIFFVISFEGRIQYINRRGIMLLRTNEEKIKNRKYNEIFLDLQWPHLTQIIEMANRTMMPVHDQEITARLDTGMHTYLANIVPIHDFNRSYSLLMCSLHDITKFNQKINLASQLERIIQSIPDPMIIVDENLEIRLINNATLELSDINPLQIRDSAMPLCSDVFHLRKCNTDSCPMYKFLHNKKPIKDMEMEIQDAHGRMRTFLLTIIEIEMKTSARLFLMRFSDITIKKEYEKELKVYQAKLQEENVKLQEKIFQMKITPVLETSKAKSKKIKAKTQVQDKETLLDINTSYLCLDSNEDMAYSRFLNQVHAGRLGLVISRMHPDKIRKKYNLKETPIVWVNNSIVDEQKKYVQPNLQILLHLFKNFLKETNDKENTSVILFDCLEYLGIYNDFKKLVQFFEVINENITLNNSIGIFKIHSDAFSIKELALLKRSTIPLNHE
ncbi:MAG: DUF835 domain-containing protein [Promethearchaeota archaeon]